MAKFPVVLVLEGLEEHENHQHNEDHDDALIEDLMLFRRRLVLCRIVKLCVGVDGPGRVAGGHR